MSELDWSDWSLEEASFDNMKDILSTPKGDKAEQCSATNMGDTLHHRSQNCDTSQRTNDDETVNCDINVTECVSQTNCVSQQSVDQIQEENEKLNQQQFVSGKEEETVMECSLTDIEDTLHLTSNTFHMSQRTNDEESVNGDVTECVSQTDCETQQYVNLIQRVNEQRIQQQLVSEIEEKTVKECSSANLNDTLHHTSNNVDQSRRTHDDQTVNCSTNVTVCTSQTECVLQQTVNQSKDENEEQIKKKSMGEIEHTFNQNVKETVSQIEQQIIKQTVEESVNQTGNKALNTIGIPKRILRNFKLKAKRNLKTKKDKASNVVIKRRIIKGKASPKQHSKVGQTHFGAKGRNVFKSNMSDVSGKSLVTKRVVKPDKQRSTKSQIGSQKESKDKHCIPSKQQYKPQRNVCNRKRQDSFSSDDDVPLIELKRGTPLSEPEYDSEDSYKPTANDIDSSDSEGSDYLPEKEQNKLYKEGFLKEQWNSSIRRLNSEKQNNKQVSKKVMKLKPAKKKQQQKDNAKKRCQKTLTPELNTSHAVLKESEKHLAHGKDQNSKNNTEFLTLVEIAKEESRKEEEKRKKTTILQESRLDQLLFSNGFVRQKVKSDGNCFFEASILAMKQKIDGNMLRHLLCQHLEENVEEYIGFLKNRNSVEDDVTFVKEYFRAIDLLKQSGYCSNSAGDFLPLALANWSHRPVCIYSSRPEQPVIEIQPTLCPPTEEDSICLAYMSS